MSGAIRPGEVQIDLDGDRFLIVVVAFFDGCYSIMDTQTKVLTPFCLE